MNVWAGDELNYLLNRPVKFGKTDCRLCSLLKAASKREGEE